MNAPARQVQHTNPYHKDNEKEKHDLFEAAWSKKTYFGNFIGMLDSGRKAREARVKQRVESFTMHRDAFVQHNGLPLQASYHRERDEPNHPYTGFHGRGEPVKYLDHAQNDRQAFAIKFNAGRLQQPGIKDSAGQVVAPEAVGGKAMFTRRASNADSLLAMIKSTKPERVQHSTFNAGMEVANAGFINFTETGKVDSFKLSSGHYAPDVESGVKLAMWSERHGAFDSGQARILDHSGTAMDTSMPTRMFTVQKWATRNNL